LQEALQNAVKHSGAQKFDVLLKGTPNDVQLHVLDSGVGFDANMVVATHGLGLTSMRERLRLIGGQLLIDSRPQGGTCIHASVPFSPRTKYVAAEETVAEVPLNETDVMR